MTRDFTTQIALAPSPLARRVRPGCAGWHLLPEPEVL
jgi:hypothetical protein